MPKDNIQRAIDKGTGAGADADAIERVVYEGYGPGGVAMLVDALTDNRNRTGADIRHAFTKHGGSLGEPGSVAWVFEKRGAVVVDADAHQEEDLLVAIDVGADDIEIDGDLFTVTCEPALLSAVREVLETAGVAVQSAEVRMEPSNTVEVEEPDAGALVRLMESLDDLDDVDEVHANFDIPAEVLERIAA